MLIAVVFRWRRNNQLAALIEPPPTSMNDLADRSAASDYPAPGTLISYAVASLPLAFHFDQNTEAKIFLGD
ncbi:hypothetical protein LVY75_00255 (plasmid) [Sinorhizobium sp. B11]